MQNKTEKKSHVDLIFFLIVIAVVAVVLFWKPSTKKAVDISETASELVVNVMPIKAEDVKITNSYIGYVTPINSVDVVPYINGFLEDIMVEGGQEVKQGDNLIVIKQDEYKANLSLALAKVQEAQATYSNAAIYYKRMREAGVRVISKTELDNAKAQALSSAASLSQAKANLDLAKVNYDYTIIQAPISGVVGNVSLTKGDYVSPASKSLLKIIQYDPIRVVFSITDKDYLDEVAKNPNKLFDKEKIQIRLSNGQIYDNAGQYQFMGNELDRQTNSISIYADFTNPQKVLVANAYVDVLIEKEYPNGVLLRQNLITMDSDGNYVYTVSDNKLAKKPIEIVTTIDNNYLLKNNFAPGEYIVLDKVGRIDPKQKIKIHVAGAAPASKTTRASKEKK